MQSLNSQLDTCFKDNYTYSAFTKHFQNTLEPKHTLGISPILKYVKGSTVPGSMLVPQAVSASLAMFNVCSKHITGEHLNSEMYLEGPVF